MKIKKKNGLEFYSTHYLKSRKDPRRVLRYSWRIWKQGRIIAASSEEYSKLYTAGRNLLSISNELGVGLNIKVARLIITGAMDAYKNRKKK